MVQARPPAANSSSAFCEIESAAIVGDRAEQQDACGVSILPDGSAVIVLADGMGGHAAGQVASRLAAEAFVSASKTPPATGDVSGRMFDDALDAANRALAEGRENTAQATMGTTLVGARISAEGVAWISVGDSPLWLWQGGRLMRLNEDHSLREIAKARGIPNSGALVSALVGGEIAMVDRRPTPVALREGDLVVLASDGILTLSEDDLTAVLSRTEGAPIRAVADAILAPIVTKGKTGQDNATVVVARVPQTLPCEVSDASEIGTLHDTIRRFAMPTTLGVAMAAVFAALTVTVLRRAGW